MPSITHLTINDIVKHLTAALYPNTALMPIAMLIAMPYLTNLSLVYLSCTSYGEIVAPGISYLELRPELHNIQTRDIARFLSIVTYLSAAGPIWCLQVHLEHFVSMCHVRVLHLDLEPALRPQGNKNPSLFLSVMHQNPVVLPSL